MFYISAIDTFTFEVDALVLPGEVVVKELV